MTINIRYAGVVVPIARGATVLEGLEKAGIVAPSSCRAGVCQFCLMRAVDGPVPPRSQDGLKPSLKSSGHFLACVGRPDDHLTCEPAYSGVDFRGEVVINEVRPIADDVVLVTFVRPEAFRFVAGQFVSLRDDDGLVRSYSIATPAGEPTFSIHVRRIPGGRMSTWLHDRARPGDTLWAEGPKGDCIYYPGQAEQALTLVGTGTGIAPLFALAQDALRQGHKGPIRFYQGALTEERFYFVDELSTLAATAANVTYIRCALRGPASSPVVQGDLKDVVVSDLKHGSDGHGQTYLCGDPAMVRDLKKRLFLAGMSLRNLHADAFIGTGV